MSSKQLLGVAGVHYVTAKLARLGMHVVPTTRNVKGPDIFVGNEDGDRWSPVQVKTTQFAARTRGRGKNKVLGRYEWDIGWSSVFWAHRIQPSGYFALVDMRDDGSDRHRTWSNEPPDVYVVPTGVIAEWFPPNQEWPRARYHPKIAEIEEYRNNWSAMVEALLRRDS